MDLTQRQSGKDGGIRMALQVQVTAQCKALIGALKIVYYMCVYIVYWLAKEDVTFTTKYVSFMNLAQSLRCSYLNDLFVQVSR